MKLFDYIKGNRKGKEAHRLEKEAMSDPFLWEALEGFDSVKGDHAEAIERLRGRVSALTAPRRRKRTWLLATGVAAGLLLLLTLGGRWLWPDKPEQIVPYLAQSTETSAEADINIKNTGDSTVQPALPMEIAQVLEQPIQPAHSAASYIAPDVEPFAVEEPLTENTPPAEKVTAAIQSLSAAGAVPKEPSRLLTRSHMADPPPVETDTALPLSKTDLWVMDEQGVIRAVSGRVVDPQGQALPGATVRSHRTGSTAVTDANGNFQLDVPPDDILRVSYIGHKTASVQAGSLPGQVVLQTEEMQLDEVVVAAYGTRRNSEMVGSAAAKTTEPQASTAYIGPKGGMAEFKKYVRENKADLSEPDGRPVTGEVTLEFRVNRHGRPSNIRVVRGLSPKANAEAKRLLEKGPDWQPSDNKIWVVIEL